MNHTAEEITTLLSSNITLQPILDSGILPVIFTNTSLLLTFVKKFSAVKLNSLFKLSSSNFNSLVCFEGTIINVSKGFRLEKSVHRHKNNASDNNAINTPASNTTFHTKSYLPHHSSIPSYIPSYIDGTKCSLEYGLSNFIDCYSFTIQNNLGRVPRSFDCYLEANEHLKEPRIGESVKAYGLFKSIHKSNGVFTTVFVVYFIEYSKGERKSIFDINEMFGEVNPLNNAYDIKNANGNINNENASFEDLEYDNIYIRNSEMINLFPMRKFLTMENLSKLIAPTVYGLENIKKSILLQLLGGTVNKGRSAIHILLYGDPSCSKSQFLKFITNTIPDSIYCSGRGASNAGITLTINITDNTFAPGALVLAKSVCCIDEFDKVSLNLYEPMEQMTVSISKNGMHTSLKVRAGVLAAANELNVEESLLTRFDLVWELRDDKVNEGVVKQVLDNHSYTGVDDNTTYDTMDNINTRVYDNTIVTTPSQASLHFLRDFLACATKLRPYLSREARILISEYYVYLRSIKSHLKVTPRTLEAIVRLSTAHAKLRLSTVVIECDVIEAKKLFQAMLFKEEEKPVDRENKKTDEDVDLLKRNKNANNEAEDLRERILSHLFVLREMGKEFVELDSFIKEYSLDKEQSSKILKELDADDILIFNGNLIRFIN